MIFRYKWYKVRLPCSVTDFFTRLRANGYKPQNASGFLANEAESSFRYVWTSIINAIRLDSEGNNEYEKITTINSQSVTLLGSHPVILRFDNPPRSLRDVLNALENSTGFGFTCEQVIITDTLVQTALSNASCKTLNSLKLSGSLPEAESLARLELASKTGINAEKIKFLNLGNFSIDAASYEIIYKGLKGQIGFSRTAACKISGPLTPYILENLENALILEQIQNTPT
ncbi:hypothetical protein [Pseudomonas sp. DWP1b1]|uniref:hypothetical protein n=1 Tax=unclassified Pseudomonas TaxID=196821 RepID=UPI003CEBD625